MNKITKIFFAVIIVAAASLLLLNCYKSEDKDYELKKKIGQMLIIGFRGAEADRLSYISRTINSLNIGGVILFDKDNPSSGTISPRNIVNYDQVKTLIQNLNKYSPSPLFVSVDAEGGYINRLKEKYGFINIPSAEQMGK